MQIDISPIVEKLTALPASVRADAPIRESADVDRYARVHGEGRNDGGWRGGWMKRRGMREGTRYAPRYSNNSSSSRSNLLAARVYRCRRETASDASIATSKIQYARPPGERVGSVNPYLSLALSCASSPCHSLPHSPPLGFSTASAMQMQRWSCR